MQWNCTSPFLQNLGYDPFSFSKAPSYPQIIGEGDVTSVILPDGTIQLFFVPTKRQVTLSPFQFNTNCPNHCTANKDIWFVRSISHPLPPNLLDRPFPNVYGDQQPPPQFSPNFCISSPSSPGYYQKFHNDDYTSTTDIHYFYPSLRYNGHLKYSAEVQTESYNTLAWGGCQGHCGCKSPEAVLKKNSNKIGDASASSTSYMSIDSTSKSKFKLTKRNKRKSKTKKSRDSLCECHLKTKKSKHKSKKKREPYCECHLDTRKSKYKTNKSRDHSRDSDLETKKSKYKTNKSRDNLCECHLEDKETSDKLVSTFAEKASGGIIKDGRQTQTANKKSKRSDVKTEIWQPVDCNSSFLKLVSCDDCSDRCCCRSTTGSDD